MVQALPLCDLETSWSRQEAGVTMTLLRWYHSYELGRAAEVTPSRGPAGCPSG